MNIEIRDELVKRLQDAERRCDDSLGSAAKARAEQVLGEVVDEIVRGVITAIRSMSISAPRCNCKLVGGSCAHCEKEKS